MKNIVKILSIQQVTHDVKCFRFEKPAGYQFLPGQATDVSVNKPGMEKELRPFTFTALTDQPYLEFTIKSSQTRFFLNPRDKGSEITKLTALKTA